MCPYLESAAGGGRTSDDREDDGERGHTDEDPEEGDESHFEIPCVEKFSNCSFARSNWFAHAHMRARVRAPAGRALAQPVMFQIVGDSARGLVPGFAAGPLMRRGGIVGRVGQWHESTGFQPFPLGPMQGAIPRALRRLKIRPQHGAARPRIPRGWQARPQSTWQWPKAYRQKTRSPWRILLRDP